MEQSILLFIQENIRCTILNYVFVPVTHLGDGGAVWIVAALLMLIFRKTRRAGIVCAVALLSMLVINNLCIKNIVARIRPYEVIEGLVLIVGKAWDWSFPSGHTCASFAFATAVFFAAPKKIWIPAVVLAVLIAFSRLYVGIHWPTDVLGGMLIGVACGTGAYLAVKYLYKSKENQSL